MRFLKTCLVVLFASLAINGYSQTMWAALPKEDSSGTLIDGKTYVGFRWTGPTVLYAVNTNSISQSALFTCIGVNFESNTYDGTSKKFYTNWGVGLQFGEGGQFAPTSISAVTAGAVTFSVQKIGAILLPFKLTLGAIYNFTTQKAMAATGPGIPLNN